MAGSSNRPIEDHLNSGNHGGDYDRYNRGRDRGLVGEVLHLVNNLL